jgi:DNA-binding SARP family transcriptional activator/Tfp pilus assembly protein PilF
MVRLRTLGTIDLRDAGGAEVRALLVQPRRLALLACLALATPHGFQRRDRLVALFWPDDDTERARASLNRAIYFLRHTLGEGIVLSRGLEEIGLDRARFWCDAEAFETALDGGDTRCALDLYRGELMPGFFVTRAPAFEEWLELKRARLRARAADAAWTRSDVEEVAGNLSLAAQWARRAVELAPFDEVSIRRLLVLLDRHGDRAGAGDVYRRFADDLTTQLGLSPAPESLALIESIRARGAQTDCAGPIATGPAEQAGTTPAAEPEGASEARLPDRRRLRLWSAVLATVSVTIAAAFLVSQPVTNDPLRVEVTSFENRTGDPALDRLGATAAAGVFDALVQAGVVRTLPNAPARVGWLGETLPPSGTTPRGRAGTVVSGMYRREAGLVRLHAWITDRRRGNRVWQVTPVSGPIASVENLLGRVRQRVAGGVAVLQSPYYASLLPIATSPPTVEAYQEFREGLRLESARQNGEAIQHFRLAVALDPGFRWPLVHAALSGIRSFHPRGLEVDSVLGELSASPDRLSPLERHLVEYLQAVRVEDWEGCYRAIKAAAAIAPEQFSYTQAVRAMQLHRSREAVAALTRPRLDSIYRDDAKNYWFVLTLAYHHLGEHRRELATARAARRLAPANASLLTQEIRALAALRRTAAVVVRLDTLLSLPRDDWFTPATALMQVGTELRAHGQEAAAQKALARAIAWHRSRPAIEAAMEVRRFMLGWILYQAGQFAEADSVFHALHREFPDNVEYIGQLGVIAARRGDRATARRRSDQLLGREVEAPIPGEESIVWRAKIAALLGDRSEAMRLIVEAFGPQGTMELHGNRDFDGMKDYPPFREFIRPKG